LEDALLSAGKLAVSTLVEGRRADRLSREALQNCSSLAGREVLCLETSPARPELMNGEILRLVDSIHRDKDIEKEVIFQGIEAALLSAVKKKVGESETIRVVIDRVTGVTSVVEDDKVLPIEDLGRLAAQSGKQVLFQKIREAERDKIFGEYDQKVGKLVSGTVVRQEGPNLIVSLGRVEGILPRSEQAPGEKFRVGERIKVLVKDIKKNANRVKLTLSRTSPLLVKALFELEVPEISDRVIEIMEIVREPGYRTKIAVTTYDHNVDCVGACVGVRGSRIKNIVDELFGEKIDIVRWNDSIEVLIMNALKPAEIISIDLNYDTKKAIVYVKPDQQSLAIGKRGQNVRLASKLTKWELGIVTVSDADIEKLRKGEEPEDARPATEDGEPLEAESPAAGEPPTDDSLASASTEGSPGAASPTEEGSPQESSTESSSEENGDAPREGATGAPLSEGESLAGASGEAPREDRLEALDLQSDGSARSDERFADPTTG
jgi:N utilization substance protein A